MTVQKSPDPTDRHVGSRVRMRRLMLGVTQTELGGALGLTFQQVQKYESGRNRISAGRLQQISQILKVSVPFFFEGAPNLRAAGGMKEAPSADYVSDFLAKFDGKSLAKSFMQIKRGNLRRCIVKLVEEIADATDAA
jgi:transcriptional regulator with XRE-family HTH domain